MLSKVVVEEEEQETALFHEIVSISQGKQLIKPPKKREGKKEVEECGRGREKTSKREKERKVSVKGKRRRKAKINNYRITVKSFNSGKRHAERDSE